MPTTAAGGSEGQAHHERTARSPHGIFLGVRLGSAAHADALQRRLGELFALPADAVVRLDGDATTSFFIPGEPDAFDRPWWYHDDATLSATGHPILTPEVLGDPSGRGLRGFVRNLRHDSTVLASLPPPISYLHHNAVRDTIVAANDSFGIGRVYHTPPGPGSVVSNSLLAAAVALDHDPLQDDAFWEGYYVTGGGLGETTFVKGLCLAPPGSVVSITERGLTLRQQHPVEELLSAARDRPLDLERPIEAARRLLDVCRPQLQDNPTLLLSGGLDSRFVAALAVDAGIDFTAHTFVPPALEGDLAQQLHERTAGKYAWRRIAGRPGTVRQDPQTPERIDGPAEPILERAEKWFTYLGGDHWSSPTRSQTPRPPGGAAMLTLSGSHGDIARGHYYTASDAVDGAPATALRRFVASFTRYRQVLPVELRERGAQHVRNTLLDYMVAGVTGYHTLDYWYLNTRVRRQFPPIAPSMLLPMLTPEMVAETFWRTPIEKAGATVVRTLTHALVPDWEGVPYFHEAAVGTDPAVTNKVSNQETYWETDRADFDAAMETALDETDFSGMTMNEVRSEIASLPEGRNRTNQTFEFVFWHCAARRVLARIDGIRHRHPAGTRPGRLQRDPRSGSERQLR